MITITRLLSPPKHHFYGYYGIEVWDPLLRYHHAGRLMAG